MKIIRMLFVVTCVALSASAETQQQLASRLVAQYQEKVSHASGLSYKFTHEGSGPLSRAFPRTHGEVKVVPSRNGKGLFDRAHISALSGASETGHRIEVVADGEVVRSLDVEHQRVLSAPLWRNGIELVNFQYLLPVALAPQLAALQPSDFVYKGEKTIGATTCVIVEADTQMANLTLYFGKNDALLYGGVARKPEAWGDGMITMSIEGLTLERIPDDAFHLEPPKGYAEVQYSGNFPPLGEPAPGFVLKGFDGSPITLEQLAGQVVVLDFWATWCGPCKQAMPGLQQLHDRFASKGLTIIGVNHQEKGDARAFLERYGFTYTFASAEGSKMAEEYKPNLPMAVVIDREGRMVEVFSGYFGKESDERLERLIRSLL